MAWDEEDVRQHLIAEFGYASSSTHSYGEDVWFEQVEAAEAYRAVQRDRRVKERRDKKDLGICIDCHRKAKEGRVRCHFHLVEAAAKQKRYAASFDPQAPLSEVTRSAIAEAAAQRKLIRQLKRGGSL